jgi:hypothetical protein
LWNKGSIPPALGVDLDDLLGREVGLGGQNQAWARPRVVGHEHLAPHRANREPLQESRHGEDRAHPNRLHLAVQHQFHRLYRQGFEHCRIDPLAVFALPPSAFRFGLGREKQGGISPHLPDDADLLFEQGQNQAAAHEPGIDQQAHPLHVPPDRIHQLPCHPELAALCPRRRESGSNSPA